MFLGLVRPDATTSQFGLTQAWAEACTAEPNSIVVDKMNAMNWVEIRLLFVISILLFVLLTANPTNRI
jgi:uncharacterized integral membrane protein